MLNSGKDLLAILQEKLGEKAQIQAGFLGKGSVTVKPGVHREALTVLLEADEKAGIAAISGVDLGPQIGLLYHARVSDGIVTVRTEVPRDNARITTVTDLIPGANFHEREVSDLFGVVFEGHPNPKRLVLTERWPDNVFPLRKEVKVSEIKLKPESSENSADEASTQGSGELVNITIGPQHPALLEPEKFSVKVEGEIVRDVEPRIGYVHRGVEKAAESRTYLQDVYLVERICGICNSCHATCFCEAVEKILHTDVPSRAKYIRVILLEINRLHSHMLLLGHAGLEIGFETLFQYMWRDREPIMDLTEILTGNRVIASTLAVGGVRRDIQEVDVPKIKNVLATLRAKMGFYKRLYEDDSSLKMRTQKVGVLSREDALKLCVVGPVARGSNVNIDVRKDDPYEAYGEIPFKEIVYNSGDSWARFMVRMDEIYESIDIIEYALDNLPSGPFRVRVPRIVPAGESVAHVEAPRGELFYYLKSNGTAYPERVKVRTPTFANLGSFLKTAVGQSIADVPANFVSLDPCFSCTDR